jgi:hypothetical protein
MNYCTLPAGPTYAANDRTCDGDYSSEVLNAVNHLRRYQTDTFTSSLHPSPRYQIDTSAWLLYPFGCDSLTPTAKRDRQALSAAAGGVGRHADRRIGRYQPVEIAPAACVRDVASAIVRFATLWTAIVLDKILLRAPTGAQAIRLDPCPIDP